MKILYLKKALLVGVGEATLEGSVSRIASSLSLQPEMTTLSILSVSGMRDVNSSREGGVHHLEIISEYIIYRLLTLENGKIAMGHSQL